MIILITSLAILVAVLIVIFGILSIRRCDKELLEVRLEIERLKKELANED